jgi:ABC-type transport system involved in cytochrome bd biosynthesis fused ATPase/permease subunit
VQLIFCSSETRKKTDLPDEEKAAKGNDPPLAIYYTRSRIERLVVAIITVMILVLLVIPIYIMYQLVHGGNNRTDAICIGVLMVFTLAFSAVLSLFTRAKRHEILGAAAAYCAVLVVFLGNVGTSGTISNN